MYLASRPIVDNPLIPPPSMIFGQWPYYILIFQLALLAHALLVNVPFWIYRKKTHLMKRLLVFVFVWVHFSINCQQTIDGTIYHDGYHREYKLYMPASYNSNTDVPLVFSFHGLTSNANLNFLYTKFHEIADTAGFILVHPRGCYCRNPSLECWPIRFLEHRRHWVYSCTSGYDN